MFDYLDTASRLEREAIERNLIALYNRFYNEENETFLALREAKDTRRYNDAQSRYIAAVSKLGAVQAVFHELGIPFEGLFPV